MNWFHSVLAPTLTSLITLVSGHGANASSVPAMALDSNRPDPRHHSAGASAPSCLSWLFSPQFGKYLLSSQEGGRNGEEQVPLLAHNGGRRGY